MVSLLRLKRCVTCQSLIDIHVLRGEDERPFLDRRGSVSSSDEVENLSYHGHAKPNSVCQTLCGSRFGKLSPARCFSKVLIPEGPTGLVRTIVGLAPATAASYNVPYSHEIPSQYTKVSSWRDWRTTNKGVHGINGNLDHKNATWRVKAKKKPLWAKQLMKVKKVRKSRPEKKADLIETALIEAKHQLQGRQDSKREEKEEKYSAKPAVSQSEIERRLADKTDKAVDAVNEVDREAEVTVDSEDDEEEDEEEEQKAPEIVIPEEVSWYRDMRYEVGPRRPNWWWGAPFIVFTILWWIYFHLPYLLSPALLQQFYDWGLWQFGGYSDKWDNLWVFSIWMTCWIVFRLVPGILGFLFSRIFAYPGLEINNAVKVTMKFRKVAFDPQLTKDLRPEFSKAAPLSHIDNLQYVVDYSEDVYAIFDDGTSRLARNLIDRTYEFSAELVSQALSISNLSPTMSEEAIFRRLETSIRGQHMVNNDRYYWASAVGMNSVFVAKWLAEYYKFNYRGLDFPKPESTEETSPSSMDTVLAKSDLAKSQDRNVELSYLISLKPRSPGLLSRLHSGCIWLMGRTRTQTRPIPPQFWQAY